MHSTSDDAEHKLLGKYSFSLLYCFGVMFTVVHYYSENTPSFLIYDFPAPLTWNLATWHASDNDNTPELSLGLEMLGVFPPYVLCPESVSPIEAASLAEIQNETHQEVLSLTQSPTSPACILHMGAILHQGSNSRKSHHDLENHRSGWKAWWTAEKTKWRPGEG